MTPTADPASPAAAASILPANVLQDGEIVILAIKPSGWSLLLSSWPVLAIAAAVAGATLVAERLQTSTLVSPGLVLLICAAAAVLRVLLAGMQWLGRLYVLTNRRVLQVHGLLRVDVRGCLLREIVETSLSATAPERLLAIGNLYLRTVEDDRPQPAWPHIARPAEVQQIVNEAIRHARP